MSSHFKNSYYQSLLGTCLLVFLAIGTHMALLEMDLLPSEVRAAHDRVVNAVKNVNKVVYTKTSQNQYILPETQREVAPQAKPHRIVIDEVGIDARILNPNQTSVDVLDSALEKGVVRYPGSATVGEPGNMFLFAHSSRLPVVQNQAYKAFSGLEKLSLGDSIVVYSGSKKHIYEVRSVTIVDKDKALVDFSGDETKLTLSTCSSFGTREDRVVVEAVPVLSTQS